MKKKVCILYTGGTIGMVPSPRGYVTAEGTFPQLLKQIPELQLDDCPDWDVVEFAPLLDSSDMAVKEWNKIGRAVSQLYAAYDGFVVLHGTDTMAYSASALSFMLENLQKPVIFTGAQIPLRELRSDGRDNLITALLLAASDNIREVCLYFGGKLLRGCRSVKKSSDQFEAFESPNAPVLAEAGITIDFYPAEQPPAAHGSFLFQPFQEDLPIGVIKVFPGIQFEFFESIMTDKLRGVVLETFGAGNIPSRGTSLLPIIEKAHRSGSVITVCSQCQEGSVILGSYATSNSLKSIGAVDGKDMTTEAALAKLYYLFSKGYSADKVREEMKKNLRGEITL